MRAASSATPQPVIRCCPRSAPETAWSSIRVRMRKAVPKVGDIVVFYARADAAMQPPVCGARHAAREVCPAAGGRKSTELLIRRIVAGPGDTIEIVEGHVIRNGERESGEHTEPCRAGDACDFPAAVRLPVDDYFMLGDNRGGSDDSRFWGPVPRARIVGKVVGIVARGGAIVGS